ncbi:MAG: hypothetical protein LRY67_02535 [Gammaproteobacteria bacterium]|nr:hypothetical protein [Gammaproteobacteria bacterium]
MAKEIPKTPSTQSARFVQRCSSNFFSQSITKTKAPSLQDQNLPPDEAPSAYLVNYDTMSSFHALLWLLADCGSLTITPEELENGLKKHSTLQGLRLKKSSLLLDDLISPLNASNKKKLILITHLTHAILTITENCLCFARYFMGHYHGQKTFRYL